jgi:O-antigen/teichoic acid export membrane protein
VIFGGEGFRPAFRLAMAILFLSGVGEIPLSLIKAERRSIFFITLAISKLVCEVGLKIYLIVALRLGWYGALLGSALAWSVFATLPAVWLLRRTGLRFVRTIAGKLAIFCLPLVLSGVLGFALHSADRYMLRWFFQGETQESLGEVGLYALAYRLGYVMNFLILDPFLLIWFPFIFSIRKESEQKRTLSRIATYLFAAMVFGSFALAVTIDEVILIAGQEYRAAASLVPVILLGYVFWALYEIFHTPFFIVKQTRPLPFIVGLAATTNITLNSILIPRYGAVGAAWATVVAFIVLSALALVRSAKLLRVRYEWGRLALPLLLATLLYLLFLQARPAALVLRLLVELLTIAAFPLLLLLCGFVRREEMLRVKELLARILKRSSPQNKPSSPNGEGYSSAAASSVAPAHDR